MICALAMGGLATEARRLGIQVFLQGSLDRRRDSTKGLLHPRDRKPI